MPLDPSLFLQAAALRNQNNAQLQQSIQSGVDNAYKNKALKVEQDKASVAGFDFDKLAQKSALKIQSGLGTPEDANILKTWDMFNQTKVAQDPTTGNYRKANESILGGFDLSALKPQGMGPIGNQMVPNDIKLANTTTPSLDQTVNVLGTGNTGQGLGVVPGAPGMNMGKVGLNTDAVAPKIQVPSEILDNPNAAQKYKESAAGELGKSDAEKSVNAPKAEAALLDTASRMNNVDKKIDSAISQVGNTTAGLGSNLKDVPLVGKGSSAYDLKSTLDTIKADAAFSELQKMRDNSKTGGALGQVSEKELELLTSAAASLDQGQSPGKLKENLKNYQNLRRQSLKRVADAFEKDNGYRPDFEMKAPDDKKATSWQEYFK